MFKRIHSDYSYQSWVYFVTTNSRIPFIFMIISPLLQDFRPSASIDSGVTVNFSNIRYLPKIICGSLPSITSLNGLSIPTGLDSLAIFRKYLMVQNGFIWNNLLGRNLILSYTAVYRIPQHQYSLNVGDPLRTLPALVVCALHRYDSYHMNNRRIHQNFEKIKIKRFSLPKSPYNHDSK